MTKEEEYRDLMEKLSKLRERSIDDPEAREEYNRILESPEFIELENQLIYAAGK